MRRLITLTLCAVAAAAPAEPKPFTACVTGASGFLGVELVAQLLEKGWIVRGTVRSVKNAAKVAPLRALAGAERLELVEADLLGGPGEFAACVAGADALFHTASPFVTEFEDAEKELVQPAVQGTRDAVAAALAAKTVSRIVLTSSVAAVMGQWMDNGGKCYTESDWNWSSRAENGGLDAYRYSKLAAERAFWAELEGSDVTGASILPSFIVGPPRTPRVDGESLRNMKLALEGELPHRGDTPMADVRDVASAHIAAWLHYPSAAPERYLVTSRKAVKRDRLLNNLRKWYPDYEIHAAASDASDASDGPDVFCSKTLGRLVHKEHHEVAVTPSRVTHHPPDLALEDMAKKMLELGSATPRRKGGGEEL